MVHSPQIGCKAGGVIPGEKRGGVTQKKDNHKLCKYRYYGCTICEVEKKERSLDREILV